MRSGNILMRAYPWMTSEMLCRSRETIVALKESFLAASESKCTIQRSTVRNEPSSTDELTRLTDVLGVVATANIKANDAVLIDPTVVGTINNWTGRCQCCCRPLPKKPIRFPCCEDQVCSKQCANRALKLYHSAVCGMDLSSFHVAAKLDSLSVDSAARLQLLLRILAVVLHSRASHPLHAPILNHLTAAYDLDRRVVFDYQRNIVRPHKLLQALGINIFEDLRFDTWVLQTIQFRLNNNQHGEAYGVDGGYMALSPHYSLFNHSCAPNVAYRSVDSTTTILMHAERDIIKGEELFISYINDSASMNREERQNEMKNWIGFDCRCERCKRETS